MAVIASQLIGKVGLEGSEKTLSGLKQIGEHTEKAESSFKKLREQVARGFEFGTGMQLAQIPGSIFDAAKEQFVDVIKLALDHQQIMAQTNQVLKSTHDVSKMTAGSLDELAQKFGKTTEFSADTVQQGENLLLTFTNIGHQVFPQATQAILDVSQAMGQDLKESAIQVGKALGDPLTGMTALQRIGVTFSASEKEQIKTMMAHHDVIGAQKVILKELSTEFGGSAEAAGKTFAGQLKIAQDRVEELKIKIGTALLPILNEFLQYFEQHIMPRLDDFSQWFQKDGIPKLQEFGDWFQKDGIPLLSQFGTDIGNVIGWFQQGGPAVDILRDAFVGVGLAIIGIKIVDFGKDVANTVHDSINNVKSFIDTIGKIKDKLSDVSDFFANNFSTKAKTALDDVGKTSDATGKSVSGIGSAAEGNVTKVEGAAVKEETALGETTITADVTGDAVAGIGTKAEVAAGESGVGGLTGAVGKLFNIVGPALGLGLLAEQLNIAIPILTGQANDPGAGPNPTLKHYHGPHSFASGVTNFEGGLAYVHQNELLVNMPRGTNVIPASAASGGQGGGNQTLILTIDGVQFARVAMPYLTNMTRYAVGSVGW